MDRKLVYTVLSRLRPGDIVTFVYRNGTKERACYRSTMKSGRAFIGLFDTGDGIVTLGTTKKFREHVAAVLFPDGYVYETSHKSGKVAKPKVRPEIAEQMYDIGCQIIDRFRSGLRTRVRLFYSDGTFKDCEVLGANKLRGKKKQVSLKLRSEASNRVFSIMTYKASANIDRIEVLEDSPSLPERVE